jgi:hypothetical protein
MPKTATVSCTVHLVPLVLHLMSVALWPKNLRYLFTPLETCLLFLMGRKSLLINDLRLRKITYEKIKLFLKNEPNFRKSQVNVTTFTTKNYDQMDTWSIRKKQSQTNPNKAKFIPNFPIPNSQTYPISHQRTMNNEQRANNKQSQFQGGACALIG